MPSTRANMRSKSSGQSSRKLRSKSHDDASKRFTRRSLRSHAQATAGPKEVPTPRQVTPTKKAGSEQGSATRSQPREHDGDESQIKLMNQSGQTVEERRTLRRSQRLLYKKIMESGCDLDIPEVIQENNDLYQKVAHLREAELDAANVRAIADRVLQNALCATKVLQYDADRLVNKLKSKFRHGSGRGFDWASYSNQYGVWASALPTKVSFLNGPLTGGKPVVVRRPPAKRIRIVEEECEEEEPEHVQGHTERNADQLSAVQKSIIVLNKTLRKRVDDTYIGHKRKLEEIHGKDAIPTKLQKKLKEHGNDIDAIQYLCNPNSFTQTVENFFHYSFLVNEGVATLRVKEKGFQGAPGGAVCKYVEKDGEIKLPPKTQAVVSLTMKDWRDLCKAYEVTKGDVPHRTGSKQTRSVDFTNTPAVEDE